MSTRLKTLQRERAESIARTEAIDDLIYAEYLPTRIIQAHEFIKLDVKNTSDEYYLVADDIATRLLSDFPSYYELDQRSIFDRIL